MANWQFRLELKDVWEKSKRNEITTQALGKIVAERLEQLADKLPEDYKEEALDIAANFKTVGEDKEEFDEYMTQLYDLGDTIVGTPQNFFDTKKLIWIATF